jgi:hypothetical protein
MTIVYQTVTAGDVYSRTITASNTIYFAAENLPQGLSINQEGVISGELQQAGRFAITVLARGVGGTGAAVLDLTVIAPPTPFITSVDSVTHEMATAFSYQITASSPTAILSYGATNLPTGLSVNTGTGLITGTPTSASDDAVITVTAIVSATNAAGTGNQNLIFTLQQRPVITSSLTPLTFVSGVAITPYTITASKSPTLFGASPIPSGLSINTSTGIISGTPATPPGSVAQSTNIILSASNQYFTGVATLNVTVNVPPIITSGNTTGDDGGAFSYQITLGGGTSNAASLYGATNLPSGVSINTSTGLISGTLNSGWPETGIMSIGLSAVSVLGPTITKTITLTINPGLFDGGGQVSPSATYGTLFADYYTGQNRVRYVSNLLGGTRYLRTLGSSFGPYPGTIRLRGVIETFNNKIYASYTDNNTTFNIAKWNGSSWAPYYQQALDGQNGESPLLFDTNNSIYFMDNTAVKKITDAGVVSTFLTGLTTILTSISIYNHNGSSQYMLVARLASFANPTNIIFEFYNMSGTLLYTVTKSGVNTGPGGNYGVVTGLAPFAPFVASPLSYGFTAYASGNNYRLSTFTQAGETLVNPNVAPFLPVITFQWGFGPGVNASGQPSSDGALYYYSNYTGGNRTLTYLRTDVSITSLPAYNYATTSVTPGSRNGPLP